MLALALCLSLAACGGSGSTDDDDGGEEYTSAAPEAFEGMVKDDDLLLLDYGMYFGAWAGEDGSQLIVGRSDSREVRFELYDTEELITASGYVQLVQEYSADYFYNEHDGWAHHCWLDEDGALHIDTFGVFTKVPLEDDRAALAETWFSDDGRGDTFPEEIPVLLGGALPFTGMQTLRADNYEDGTYYYADVTEDGQITVVNTAERSCFVPEVQDMADYLSGCALSLCESDTCQLLSVEANEESGETLGCPVFIVTYTAGMNEDTRNWTVFAADTGVYTYLYGFCETPEAPEDMADIYQTIFAQLHWSEQEGGAST